MRTLQKLGIWGRSGVAGLALLALMLTSSACSGSDSGSADEVEEEPFLRVGTDTSFDVAAGDGTGWLLVQGEPAEVWQIASDGILTRVAELPDGGQAITNLGDGAAVTYFDCRDPSHTDCGDPKGTLHLLGPDGSIDHEIPLIGSEAQSLEGVSLTLLGSSDERVWVEARAQGPEISVVDRSGDVATIPPAPERDNALVYTCVAGDELVTARIVEQGPTGPDEPFRQTIELESFSDDDGEWHPVEGGSRTFELMGAGVWVDCDGISVRVQGPEAPVALWTPDDGWTELPAAAEPPPGDWVSSEGCVECVWLADGRILRLDDAGVYRPTGLGVSDPDAPEASGPPEPPSLTITDISATGAVAACARFPATADAPATTVVPPTAAVTAGLVAQKAQESPLVCDFATG